MLVLLYFAFVFWVVWKFYDILARMNENLGSIRRALEHRSDYLRNQ